MSVFNRAGVAALVLVTAISPVFAQDEAQLTERVEQLSPSIVNVRVVLKVEVSRMGQVMQTVEQRSQMTGVVVDASGLIMVANSNVSANRLNEMPQFKAQQLRASIVPTNLKVIFDGAEEEHAAYLAASDTDLDLAFLQLETTDGLELAPVSFEGTTRPTIGARLIQVSRLSEGFDYAPHFKLGRVSGRVKKPRKAWLVDGGFTGAGLPLLTLDGEVVGVLTSLQSGIDEGGMAAMAGGGPVNTGQPVMIESKVIRGVVKQAKTRAAELAAERAKAAEKPAEKKPAEKKPADEAPPTSKPTDGGK